MRINGTNSSQVGHQDDVGYINYINDTNNNEQVQMGGVGAMRLPPANGNIIFCTTSIMLQL